MCYKKICLIICIVAISSCSLFSDSVNSQNAASTFDVDEAALERELLLIQLPPESPKNLSIRTPAGEWFVVRDSEASIEVMPQAGFEPLTTMTFQIETLKGTIRRESQEITDLIFTHPGDYLGYFTDNLEPENRFSLQETIVFKK